MQIPAAEIRPYRFNGTAPPDECDPVYRIPTTHVFYPHGSDVFSQGEPCEHFLVVEYGWAAMYHLLEDGRRRILGIGLPGDRIGLSITPDTERDFGVIALSPLSVTIGRNIYLRTAIRGDGKIAQQICTELEDLARKSQQNLITLSSRSAEERVCNLLLSLALRILKRMPQAGERVAIPLTQLVIGDATGLSYVHVNRVLKSLRDKGVLSLHGGVMTIHMPERFMRTAHLESSRNTGSRRANEKIGTVPTPENRDPNDQRGGWL